MRAYGILDKKRGTIHSVTTGKKRFEDRLKRDFWQAKGATAVGSDFNQAKFMEGKVRVEITFREVEA